MIPLLYSAQLVPVFSFGENDLYDQMENPIGSSLRKFQVAVKNYFGFTVPVFSGRGIFNYTIGLMPHRKPVATIGKLLLSEFLTENFQQFSKCGFQCNLHYTEVNLDYADVYLDYSKFTVV